GGLGTPRTARTGVAGHVRGVTRVRRALVRGADGGRTSAPGSAFRGWRGERREHPQPRRLPRRAAPRAARPPHRGRRARGPRQHAAGGHLGGRPLRVSGTRLDPMRRWLLVRAQHAPMMVRPLLLRLMEFAENFFAPRQPIGVLAVVVNADGHILVAQHATRPHEPWGLPGGWLARREVPERGVLREVGEELGIPVTLEGYVGSHEHDYGWLPPRGLTLVYRLSSPLADAD